MCHLPRTISTGNDSGNHPWTVSFFALLDFLLLWGADTLLLKAQAPAAVLASVLAISIRQSSYGILNGILFLTLPFVNSRVLGMPMSLIAAVLSFILCASVCYFTWRRFALEDSPANSYFMMLLTPALLLFATGFYILNTAYGNVVITPLSFEPAKHLELLLIQILCICAMFSSLHAYKRLRESFEMKSKLALLQQEAQNQKTYVAEAKARYEQTRSFRHDIKNHLLVLKGLLHTGQIPKAQSYLDNLEAATEGLSLSFQTGNPVVDILLSSKLEAARQAGINTVCSLRLPQPWNINDIDLCIIFSNALDNAIQACSPLEGEKTIHISGEQQGDFYLLEFKNNCLCSPPYKPEPGTGLQNVKAVAEKHGGAVTIECRSSYFYLDVLLNIS